MQLIALLLFRIIDLAITRSHRRISGKEIIIYPNEILLNFLLSLQLSFSQLQAQQLQRLVEALIVTLGRKTLASLYRRAVENPSV